MAKLILSVCLLLIALPAFSQTQAKNIPANQTTAKPTSNTTQRVQADQLSKAAKTDQTSFAHIEALDRNVEETSKEIAALKKAHELAKLKAQANKLRLTFGVLRIFGIDDKLTATLFFDNRMMYNVKPGDLIQGRYLVKAITRDNVEAFDKTTQQNFFIPFAN